MPGAAGCCRAVRTCAPLSGAAGCCRVAGLPGCRVLPGAAGCCRVLPGCRVAGLCCQGSCRGHLWPRPWPSLGLVVFFLVSCCGFFCFFLVHLCFLFFCFCFLIFVGGAAKEKREARPRRKKRGGVWGVSPQPPAFCHSRNANKPCPPQALRATRKQQEPAQKERARLEVLF